MNTFERTLFWLLRQPSTLRSDKYRIMTIGVYNELYKNRRKVRANNRAVVYCMSAFAFPLKGLYRSYPQFARVIQMLEQFLYTWLWHVHFPLPIQTNFDIVSGLLA